MKHMSFFKRACQQKKSACGSGQRSKHGLGFRIFTNIGQILINIVLLEIVFIGKPFFTINYINLRLFIISAIQWRISLLTHENTRS